MSLTIKYTKDFVTSKDGTEIGYRQFGKGTGLILVHGGMMASQNLMKLGEPLADQFTIYIPDRQGRGLSQAHSNFGLTPESEDLQALVNKTKAENIYGLSAGAVIVLQNYSIPLKKVVSLYSYNEKVSRSNMGIYSLRGFRRKAVETNTQLAYRICLFIIL